MAEWKRFTILYDAESKEGKQIDAWKNEQPNVCDSVRKLILGQPLLSEIKKDIRELKQIASRPGREYMPTPEPVFEEPEIEIKETDEKPADKKGASMFFDD